MTVVGIDLGTTNTVIAAVREGRATALKDKLGKSLLPSVVSFTPRGGAKIGHEAKARRTLDPDNTVFSIKRLIGRSFDSEHVQKALSRFPFELKEGPGHSVLVSAYGQDHTLPEISALVLKQAAEIAEARLGTAVTDAVITVPANFNDLQRAATKIAGRTAGLEVLRIINEPTAAALAYGFGKSGHERIAIYDFGGGTFDVTILDLNENVFEVLATAGDTFLGGDDIDQAIMDRMAEKLLSEQKVDAEKDNLVREQLRAAAEKLKIDLTTRSLAKSRIEELEFDFTMRRSEFEKLTEPLLARTLSVAKEAMEIAGLDNSGLDQVLLVGGSTRIPLVRRRISSFFGKMPQSRINPDEVVAIGAAIQASSLEAKQGVASIPAAPGRNLSRPAGRASNAPGSDGPDLSRTKTGLAGLGKTLSGAGGGSQAPGKSSSSLKSLQSIPPAVTGLPGAAGKLNPARTLSGVGGSLSPAPLTNKTGEAQTKPGAASQEGRGQSTTNLGLGVQPDTPPLTFDDVTAVAPSPDAAAAALDQEARQPRQGTLPGTGETDPLFDGYEYEEVEDEEVTDGSVTFDLASLGLEDGEPDSLADIDEETTQIYDSKKSKDLPTTPSSTMEEIGDSALFSLDESDGTEEADLPSPASKRSEERPTDSVLTALQAETDLPTVSADQGLSTTKAGLPAPVSPRSGFGDGDELEDTEVGHRSPHENLPLRADRNQNLPSPLASNLPEKRKGARTNLGPLVAKPSTPPASRPPAELDFDGAIQNSPPAAPGIEELDELSVAALLPDDDSDDQIAVTVDPDEAEIPMSGGGPSFSPGAFLRQSGAAPAAEAPRQVPPPGSSPTPGTSSPPPSAGQRRGAPLLLDVTPLSLGVEVSGGYVDQLIARNSPIPCESTRTFATTRDNQPLVRVRVSQGEEDRFNRNTLLGELELTGLSQGPRGTVKVDVSFALDESGMLQVTARDVASGNAANARLTLVGLGENIERGA